MRKRFGVLPAESIRPTHFLASLSPAKDAAPWLAAGSFRFGIPPEADLEFFGDSEAKSLYSKAAQRLQEVGGEPVVIDFAPFRAAAELLYSGPWVAERLAAVGAYLDQMHPVVKQIISAGAKYSAVDAFNASYRLQELLKKSKAQWEEMDVLLLPTTGTIYTHDQIAADPIRLNSNLGYYTNFVNLLDLAAVAAPAGFRTNGLPFGITFIGPAFSDAALLQLTGLYMGSTRREGRIPGCVSIAVVGAHLTGQPLNRELTARGARLMKTCRTAPGYRLFAFATPNLRSLASSGTKHSPALALRSRCGPSRRMNSAASLPPYHRRLASAARR